MKLPEFRVILERLPPFQKAYPHLEDCDDIDEYDEIMGQRTKLGGSPDWEQESEIPECRNCSKEMTFVAQIDSIEHDTDSNPHAVDCLSDKQQWMFGDVGMIYVFHCFECGLSHATNQCY